MHAEREPEVDGRVAKFSAARSRQCYPLGKSAISLHGECAGYRWRGPILPSLIQHFCRLVRRNPWRFRFSHHVCMMA